LADFKKIFADSAFLCGFRSCPRAVHGFLNADELKEHETTHIVNLLCSDDNCEYSKIGFKTARTLKRHILDFHTASTARIIPPSIHRIDTSLSGGTLVSERYAGKDSDEEPPSPEPLPIDPGFPVNRNPLLGKPWEPAVEDLVDELSGDVV
jgi:hypothetical protein